MRTKESNSKQVRNHRERLKKLGAITHSLNPDNGRTKCNRVVFYGTEVVDGESNCLVCNKKTLSVNK